MPDWGTSRTKKRRSEGEWGMHVEGLKTEQELLEFGKTQQNGVKSSPISSWYILIRRKVK